MILAYVTLAYAVIGAMTWAFVVYSDWRYEHSWRDVDWGTAVTSFFLWPMFWALIVLEIMEDLISRPEDRE